MTKQRLRSLVAAHMAIVVFAIMSSVSIDAVTSWLGRPSRGVGYGIGVHYLSIAITAIGVVTLVVATVAGRRPPLAIGTIGCLIVVVALFPQPSLLVRLLLGLWVSVILGVLVVVTQWSGSNE